MGDYEPLGNIEESPEPAPNAPPPPPPLPDAAPAPGGGEYEVPNFGPGTLASAPAAPAARPPQRRPAAEPDEETDLRSPSVKDRDGPLPRKKQSNNLPKGVLNQPNKEDNAASAVKSPAGKPKNRPKKGIGRDVAIILVIIVIAALVMSGIAYGFLHVTDNLTKDILTGV